jgi:hypothetical protein
MASVNEEGDEEMVCMYIDANSIIIRHLLRKNAAEGHGLPTYWSDQARTFIKKTVTQLAPRYYLRDTRTDEAPPLEFTDELACADFPLTLDDVLMAMCGIRRTGIRDGVVQEYMLEPHNPARGLITKDLLGSLMDLVVLMGNTYAGNRVCFSWHEFLARANASQ